MEFITEADVSRLVMVVIAVAVTIGFSQLAIWLYRRDFRALAKAPETDLFESAFLLGGRRRVLKVVLHELKTERMIESGDQGNLRALFETGNETHGELAKALVEWLWQNQDASPEQILAMPWPELENIEARVIKKALCLSERQLLECKWMAFFPLGAVIGWEAKLLIGHLSSFNSLSPYAAVLSLSTLALVALNKQVKRTTLLGEKRIEELRAKRRAASAHEAYDLLWQTKDKVLFGEM